MHNTGLGKGSRLATFFAKRDLGTANQKYNGLSINHEQFENFYNKIMGDMTMTENAQMLAIGRKGSAVLKGFNTQANTVLKELEGFHKHLESTLYSNKATMTAEQTQLLGVISKQFDEEGLGYLTRSPFVSAPVTFLAKAGILPAGTGELVIETVNNKFSSDVLANMKDTGMAINAIKDTIQQENDIIAYHSPEEGHMKKLELSDASQELQQMTRGY